MMNTGPTLWQALQDSSPPLFHFMSSLGETQYLTQVSALVMVYVVGLSVSDLKHNSLLYCSYFHQDVCCVLSICLVFQVLEKVCSPCVDLLLEKIEK